MFFLPHILITISLPLPPLRASYFSTHPNSHLLFLSSLEYEQTSIKIHFISSHFATNSTLLVWPMRTYFVSFRECFLAFLAKTKKKIAFEPIKLLTLCIILDMQRGYIYITFGKRPGTSDVNFPFFLPSFSCPCLPAPASGPCLAPALTLDCTVCVEIAPLSFV